MSACYGLEEVSREFELGEGEGVEGVEEVDDVCVAVDWRLSIFLFSLHIFIGEQGGKYTLLGSSTTGVPNAYSDLSTEQVSS